MRTAPVTGWLRRTLVLATTALALTLSTLLLSPSLASASDIDCSDRSCSVPQSHTGWVYLPSAQTVCISGAICPASVAAYSWTGSAWAATSIARSQWIYVTPYAAGWRWAYTNGTGWVAISASMYLQDPARTPILY